MSFVPRNGTLLMIVVLIGLASTGCSTEANRTREKESLMPGGVFNLRVVSDSVPDWSSRKAFVHSALSGWKTDHEKALAQFRWSYLGRRVGSTWYDHGRAVHDPVLFFNSYGLTMCGDISSINLALWEAAGWKARNIEVHDHVVAEVFYDGGWHMFDNDFYNYFLNQQGAVASGKELHEGRKKIKGKHYLFDHCPTASCPDGRIYMGPSSWALSGVAKDWWDRYRPRPVFASAKAGHRYVLGLRRGESYTRYWKPLGLGARYCRMRRGKDPMAKGGTVLMNCRANGKWKWTPDLADPNALHASENASCTRSGISRKNPEQPGAAVFRVMAANVVTSARLAARASGRLSFSVSGNAGLSWTALSVKKSKDGRLEGTLGTAIGGRLEYLLKVELGKGAELKSLELETITQVNPRVLPALRLGRNRIAAVSDEHLEYLSFYPRLSNDAHKKEAFRAEGWQSVRKPRTMDSSIRGTKACELVFKADAPREIRLLRLSCTAHLQEASATLFCEASFDSGKSWKLIGKRAFAGALYDQRLCFETREVPKGAKSVLLRYRFDEGGSGLVDVFAEVGYRPAGPRMAYDLSYCWEEYRDGKWLERSHTERVKSADHRYAFNIGGTRPPRMKSVRVSPAGRSKTGYSDGNDAGSKSGRARHVLTYGKKLSDGCKYTVNRKAAKAFPDRAGKVLTNGYVGLASYWGLGGINLSGKKNQRRVGELVVWEAGEELAITLDLGKLQKVGGARICAVQPNKGVLYPAKMIVELSRDGKSFRKAGEVGWEEVFFPSADFLHWEGFDSPLYDELPAQGRIDFKFPVVFTQQQARYVRFRLAPPQGAAAGIGLWELEVYSKITKRPWSDHISLPRKAGKKER
jgi:hypothetical protein